MKKIITPLAAIALTAALTLSGSVAAQAASGVNYVSRACSSGQTIRTSVTSYSGQVVQSIAPSTGGGIIGPTVYAGQSKNWNTGVRQGEVRLSGGSSYSYSVYCA
jgi:hypothetical protein